MERSSEKLSKIRASHLAAHLCQDSDTETPSSPSTEVSSSSGSLTPSPVGLYGVHIAFSGPPSPNADELETLSWLPIPLTPRGTPHRSSSSWLSLNSSVLYNNNDSTPSVPGPVPRTTSGLQKLNTPQVQKFMHGNLPLKLHLALIGLKVYGWLQKKAGWDEREPPVQVWRNGKCLKPQDWPEELKRKYGHSATDK